MTAPAAVRGISGHDMALAAAVAGLLLVGTGVSLEEDFEISLTANSLRRRLPDPPGLLLVAAGSLPLAVRRIAPVAVLAVTAVASLAFMGLYQRPQPLPLGVLVALYTAAVAPRPLICIAVSAGYVIAVILGALAAWLPLSDHECYVYLVSVVATVTLGYGVALGRTRATLAEQRAAALAQAHQESIRAAVQHEQARIAREAHDIVAHDVSVMVALAGAARRALDSRPRTTLDALTSIEAVGRDALDGLRRLLGLLRRQADQQNRPPQPDLDQLPRLLDQVRRAGLPVELTVLGRPSPLPATVGLNAYRIIQEALTNSLKHARPTRATVTLDYRSDALRVEVRDEGCRTPAAPSREVSGGYGLISMEQRAALLGGELVAGPEREGGFRVAARLPVGGDVP